MSAPTPKETADIRLAPLLKIAEGTGKGPARSDVRFEDAAAEFGITSEDRQKPLDRQRFAALDEIKGTPKGTFSGRTAAESRAMKLDKRLPAGTTIYAHKVGDHWCVIKATPQGREILEG